MLPEQDVTLVRCAVSAKRIAARLLARDEAVGSGIHRRQIETAGLRALPRGIIGLGDC